MIKAIEFPNKEFATKKELFSELKKEKANLISLKKSAIKNADSFCFNASTVLSSEKPYSAIKEEINSNNGVPDSLNVKVVINTTNFLDSHGDVHINGIWNKTLKDNKSFLHLQEHEREFDKVISDDAKGYVMKDAKINFMVYWFKEEIEKEILIILPELNFEKNI